MTRPSTTGSSDATMGIRRGGGGSGGRGRAITGDGVGRWTRGGAAKARRPSTTVMAAWVASDWRTAWMVSVVAPTVMV